MRQEDEGPNRRRFLANVAGASTALAAVAIAETAIADTAGAETAGTQKLSPKLAAQAAPGGWNLGWVDRVNQAKHRIVFDSPEIAGGTALVNAFFVMRDYVSVYQANDAEMGVVIVVRHFALPMVFGDASWSQFKLGELSKTKDPATGEDSLRNTFLQASPKALQAAPKAGAEEKTTLPYPGAAVDALIARGVTFLCCNEALKHFADTVGKAANMSGEEARLALTASLVPGTLLVPSGIFGLACAEEAGCHYIKSS